MSIKTFFTSTGLFIGAGAGVAFSGAASLLGLGALPGVGPLLVVGVGAAGVIGGLLLGPTGPRTAAGVTAIKLEVIPEELRHQLATLQETTVMHQEAHSPLVPQLNSILTNSQELFKRILAKDDKQTARMTALNYGDTLSKLNKALAADYYLDIRLHPKLWDNADGRLAEVAKAVTATEEQLFENIRQVNASRDIDFTVALDALVQAVNRPNAQAMLDGESA